MKVQRFSSKGLKIGHLRHLHFQYSHRFSSKQNHQKKSGHFLQSRLYLRINCKIENIENGLGLTPLHYAARNGNLLICQLILSIVSDKNPRNSRGCTPYHNAARNGHLSVCKLFIDCIKDKNPHTGGIFGTPLHIVGQRGHYEIC